MITATAVNRILSDNGKRTKAIGNASMYQGYGMYSLHTFNTDTNGKLYVTVVTVDNDTITHIGLLRKGASKLTWLPGYKLAKGFSWIIEA